MIKNITYNYCRQIDVLVNYFKNAERSAGEHIVGVEIEHFILHKTNLKAVSYYEKGGIEDILISLMINGDWKPVYEGDNLIGLEGMDSYITLEPGGQLELSINPQINIGDLDKIYIKFIQELIPILEEGNKYLAAVGYQPATKAKDIPLIPKKRYEYMYDYLSSKGKYAHNMMKGTASIHVSFDYESEEDYIKKYVVANFLALYIYNIFANSPFFEQGIYEGNSVRASIWTNCDHNRCGLVSVDNGYESYARFLLNTPPIFIRENSKIIYSKDKLLREILNPDNYSADELRHYLSMVFPDVRTKEYIELRMGDSIPYPYSLGYVALWKGLLYNDQNLELLYRMAQEANKPNIKDMGELIFKLASKGLKEKEVKYLSHLKHFMMSGQSPAEQTLDNLDAGKEQALKWCFLNKLLQQ